MAKAQIDPKPVTMAFQPQPEAAPAGGPKAKYRVLDLIWSNSQNKYFHPGEEIELDAETARVLLDIQVIAPSVLAGHKRSDA